MLHNTGKRRSQLCFTCIHNVNNSINNNSNNSNINNGNNNSSINNDSNNNIKNNSNNQPPPLLRRRSPQAATNWAMISKLLGAPSGLE